MLPELSTRNTTRFAWACEPKKLVMPSRASSPPAPRRPPPSGPLAPPPPPAINVPTSVGSELSCPKLLAVSPPGAESSGVKSVSTVSASAAVVVSTASLGISNSSKLTSSTGAMPTSSKSVDTSNILANSGSRSFESITYDIGASSRITAACTPKLIVHAGEILRRFLGVGVTFGDCAGEPFVPAAIADSGFRFADFGSCVVCGADCRDLYAPDFENSTRTAGDFAAGRLTGAVVMRQ